MVVVMKERGRASRWRAVIAHLVELGMDVHRSTGASRIVLGVVGSGKVDPRLIELMDGVHEVLRISEPYKLASRTFQAGRHDHQRRRCAHRRRRSDRHGRSVLGRERGAGATRRRPRSSAPARRSLRGGAFKPRSSPYSFQGLGEEGLQLLRDAANAHDLKLVTEVMDISQIEVIEQVRRHLPGRRAQHAELHAAARARPHAQARAAEARHLGDDRGVAAVGRIHPRRRQHGRDPVRARHPHVRDVHAQHARHLGDSDRQAADRTCRSSSTRATARGGATRWRRWRAPRWPPAPTA